jgi:hypothetical protein
MRIFSRNGLSCFVAVLAIWVALLDVRAVAMSPGPNGSGPGPDGAGTILRMEEARGAPFDARAYRILYRSTDPDGRPIDVSGPSSFPGRIHRPAAGQP